MILEDGTEMNLFIPFLPSNYLYHNHSIQIYIYIYFSIKFGYSDSFISYLTILRIVQIPFHAYDIKLHHSIHSSIIVSIYNILTGVLAGGEVEDLDDMIHALHLLRVRERVRKPEPRLVL